MRVVWLYDANITYLHGKHPTLRGRDTILGISFSSVYFAFASRSMTASILLSKNIVLDEQLKAESILRYIETGI